MFDIEALDQQRGPSSGLPGRGPGAEAARAHGSVFRYCNNATAPGRPQEGRPDGPYTYRVLEQVPCTVSALDPLLIELSDAFPPQAVDATDLDTGRPREESVTSPTVAEAWHDPRAAWASLARRSTTHLRDGVADAPARGSDAQ